MDVKAGDSDRKNNHLRGMYLIFLPDAMNVHGVRDIFWSRSAMRVTREALLMLRPRPATVCMVGVLMPSVGACAPKGSAE